MFLVHGIYRKIGADPELLQQIRLLPELFRTQGLKYIFLAILLMFVQWGTEAIKWRLMFRSAFNMPWGLAFRSVFSGLAFSIITPNRVGEFAGRVIYLPLQFRMKGTAFTFISNLGQLLITLLAGGIVLFSARHHFEKLLEPYGILPVLQVLYWFTPLSMLFVLFLYFSGSRWLGQLWRLKWLNRYREQIEAIDSLSSKTLVYVLCWSALRYLIFILQYGVLFSLSGQLPEMLTLAMAASMLFLWLSIVPTFSIAELGIRWQFAYWLFTPVSMNYPLILLVVALVWFINFILPAIIGSFILFFFKPFSEATK